MAIGEICTRDTVITTEDDTIIGAAKLMRQHHVGDIVVVKEREGETIPVGIVTDRDLVIEILAQELPPESVTVGDIMNDEILTVRDHDSIWDTVQQMRIKGVRRAPVVNQRGGLVGIVAMDDLVELLADELAELAKIVAREQTRERTTRK